MLGCSVGDAENRRLCGAEHTLKYLLDFRNLSAYSLLCSVPNRVFMLVTGILIG